MSTATMEPKVTRTITPGRKQSAWIGNGNEAVARAILDIGYDAEGYYPITPSSEVGEAVQKAYAAGETDIAFIIGTSELAAISICAGVAVAGGRAVDVTSAQGLLLKAEQMPGISGLGLPMVLNLSTREISAPLNIKNGHSDLYAALGYGWLVFMAPTVQAAYDLNILAIKLAEAVNLPAIVAYDGFHTSHANRRIMVFANRDDVREFVGPPPLPGTLEGRNGRLSLLNVKHPHTFGPYMNDDLINTKVQLELKFQKAYELLPAMFEEYAAISGRRYDFVEQYGDREADRCLVALNTAGEAAKDAVDLLAKQGERVNLVVPTVLRPWPRRELVAAFGSASRIVVAERGSQYGAGNYLANEISAALHFEASAGSADVSSAREVRVEARKPAPPKAVPLVIERTYGLGGLNFARDDALEMFRVAGEGGRLVRTEGGNRRAADGAGEIRAGETPTLPKPTRDVASPIVGMEPRNFAFAPTKEYHGAWEGDPAYEPPQTLVPLSCSQCTLNASMDGKVNLKKSVDMPMRFDKHSACPGCGIFTTLNEFLRGIDGHVVLLFNTGCGMVVTTGYPLTSFKVPYFHNLFHNGTSTATGVVEMVKRYARRGGSAGVSPAREAIGAGVAVACKPLDGKNGAGETPTLPEEITVILVTGDGGDDIGMDQLIGAALRNDPFIVLEYDNKGYMNTGAQLCYTGFKGQKNSNAAVGPAQAGKRTHHKDIVEILRGTFAPYIATVSESNATDMLKKARKAQAEVRKGNFVFVKALSVCPLNWGMDDHVGPSAISAAVDACLHPLFEIEHGITTLNYDPEKRGKKIPITAAFEKMGSAFSHLCKPEFAEVAKDVQDEVDRRWARLKLLAENPLL